MVQKQRMLSENHFSKDPTATSRYIAPRGLSLTSNDTIPLRVGFARDQCWGPAEKYRMEPIQLGSFSQNQPQSGKNLPLLVRKNYW